MRKVHCWVGGRQDEHSGVWTSTCQGGPARRGGGRRRLQSTAAYGCATCVAHHLEWLLELHAVMAVIVTKRHPDNVSDALEEGSMTNAERQPSAISVAKTAGAERWVRTFRMCCPGHHRQQMASGRSRRVHRPV